MQHDRSLPEIRPIFRQLNPAHMLTRSFFKTYFNIALPSTPTCPKW
jgi:hypothetical protein